MTTRCLFQSSAPRCHPAWVLLTIWVSMGAGAQTGSQIIYTCIDAQGAIAYQNAQCSTGQRTRAIRPYESVGIDPALAARSQAIQLEMDRRNRTLPRRVPDTPGRTRGKAQIDPCRAAKDKRDSTLKRVGLKRNYDLLSRLDSDVWDACKGF